MYVCVFFYFFLFFIFFNRCKKLAYSLKTFHVMIENDHALESLIQSPLDNGKKWSVFLEIDDGAGRSKLCTMFMLCRRKKCRLLI